MIVVALFIFMVLAGMAVGVGALVFALASWLWPAVPDLGRLETVVAVLVLDGWGAAPRLVWWRDDGRMRQLAYTMPLGVTVAELERRRDAIEQALNCSLDIWYEGGLFHLRAFTGPLPIAVPFGDFYSTPAPAGELTFGVGVARSGAVWADLVQLPHLLVGGTTGGGKTAFLRQLVTSLVLRSGPDRLRIGLIDLKGGMELNVFARLPHVLGPVIRERADCTALLGEISRQLDRRHAAFDAAGVASLAEWNARLAGEALPYVLVVVDELAELSAAETADREERASRQAQLAVLARLCRLGRACGIHVIAATQRPDADAVPGQIKANLPATLAFRVRGEVNSRILLGEGNSAAAALPPRPGRAIWQWDRDLEVQVPWLSRDEALALLARAYPAAFGECTAWVTRCPRCPGEGGG